MTKHIRRTRADYTMIFKLSVVDQVEKGELTYKQAQKLYGIQGRTTVLTWLRKYSKHGWNSLAAQQRKRLMSGPQLPLSPEQKIKELETQLAYMTEKNEFLQAVIHVIEHDFGLPVTKKPQNKSSQKKE